MMGLQPHQRGPRAGRAFLGASRLLACALTLGVLFFASLDVISSPLQGAQPSAEPQAENPAEEEAEPPDDDSDHDYQTMDLFTVPDGFDLITLTDGSVYEIEKLDPRPVSRTLGKNAELEIRLRNFVPTDNKVKWINVESIKYFEDLLLEKGDSLRGQRRFSDAYEHYALVDQVSPNWNGLFERKQQLLLENARWEIRQSHAARAFALAEELKTLSPDHPELPSLIEQVTPLLVEEPFERGRYREGRRWLARLGESFASHPEVTAWRDRYRQHAEQILQRSLEQERAERLSEAVSLAREAVRCWPETTAAAEHLERLATEYPRLVVAVERLPRHFGVWPELPAEHRSAHLIHLPMVELESLDEGGRYRSRVFQTMETRDLGLGLTLHLRPELIRGGPERSITAHDLVRTFLARAQPTGAHSDPRWRDLLRSVRSEGLLIVHLNFVRPPVHPEAWLAEYLQPKDGEEEADSAVTEGLGPFRVDAIEASQVRYVSRRPPESGSLALREVVERETGPVEALDALLHGEVDLVARVSPPRARKLREEPSIRVDRLESPEMHAITFNFDRVELRSHTLRRALMYGIDRRRWLEEVVLGGAEDERNMLAEGPFPRESYATLPNLETIAYDKTLALGLVEAARKEFDDHLPSLTLAYSPIGGHRELCERIQENWQQLGLQVRLVEQRSDAEAHFAPDLIYRTYHVLNPAREAPEIIMGSRGATVADFPSQVSPWLSSLLVDLERAEHWLSARETLRSIHRAVRNQTLLIPLWQLDVLFAHRTELTGWRVSPLWLYHDIEDWKLQPVVPD